jgi:hypothetical protein
MNARVRQSHLGKSSFELGCLISTQFEENGPTRGEPACGSLRSEDERAGSSLSAVESPPRLVGYYVSGQQMKFILRNVGDDCSDDMDASFPPMGEWLVQVPQESIDAVSSRTGNGNGVDVTSQYRRLGPGLLEDCCKGPTASA